VRRATCNVPRADVRRATCDVLCYGLRAATAPCTLHVARRTAHVARCTLHVARTRFPNPPRPAESNPREVTDAELVEQARAGDRAAFGVIVDRYQHVVYRAALAVVGRREEAEEVAQDALLRAFRSLDGFRGEASLKTWLLAITWRQALSHRRSMAVRWRRFVAAGDALPDIAAAGASHDAALAEREYRQTLAGLVARLPQKYREALMLSATGDHTFEEMSAALGVPAGTLKWRVSEARRQLRQKLARLGLER
jgi:RNA polymerase sigma-70 factor (ECF subfamily)